VRDPYVSDHLALAERAVERELEQALMDRLEQTLLAFGQGMAFVGRQVRFDIEGDELVLDPAAALLSVTAPTSVSTLSTSLLQPVLPVLRRLRQPRWDGQRRDRLRVAAVAGQAMRRSTRLACAFAWPDFVVVVVLAWRTVSSALGNWQWPLIPSVRRPEAPVQSPNDRGLRLSVAAQVGGGRPRAVEAGRR